MKRYTADFQESVRLAVLQDGLSLTEASQIHGPPITTLRAWRRRDEAGDKPWTPPLPDPPPASTSQPPIKMDREALSAALLEDYLLIHMEAVEAIKQSKEEPLKRVDAISRLSVALDRTLSALEKTGPELSRLNIAKQFLERQIQFVEEHFPQHLAAFVQVLEPFGNHLAEHMAGR